MPPVSEPQNDYSHKFQVAILDNSALTENLTDDEAKIYLDWALPIADKVAQSIQDEADSEEKRDSLMKLLRMVSRLVTYRHENDGEWFMKMLDSISKIQISLVNFGLTDEQTQILISHSDSDNITFLQHLSKALSSPTLDESQGKDIIQAPPSNISTYQTPDTNLETYQPPKHEIESYNPPNRAIDTLPSKPENGETDY